MPVMDEFREERESIKNGTKEQKIQYFKDYYRTPLIIAVVAIIFVGALIFTIATNKDSAFFAVYLNGASQPNNQWFLEDYAEYAGISTKEYELTVDTSAAFNGNYSDYDTMYTVQKISTYTGAGQIDTILGTKDSFAYYANSVLFWDLREFLTEEQIAKYEPYFYYVDQAKFNDIQWVTDSGESLHPTFADPRDPSAMEQPVPVGLYVQDSQKLNDAYAFADAEDGIMLGVLLNTSHPENVQAFIDYLMAE